jgi:hypothetical protein
MTVSPPRPVAFMVMPFRKRTVPSPPEGAPREIDFDSLWYNAFLPALEGLGYLAVRADVDCGTVIIKDMLERLAFADLVLADLTLPNVNVYYEVGVRHVARESHCVLIASDWSKQFFDVDQMRTLRYPLADGAVPASGAEAIKEFLMKHLNGLRHARTPYHELVTDKTNSTVFRDQIEAIGAFQGEVRAVRLVADPELRRQRVFALIAQSRDSLDRPEIASELLALVRDNLSWQDLVNFIEQLPSSLRSDGFIKEQLLLARAKSGDHETAIEGFHELLRQQGETAERFGLIAGRYKTLWRQLRDQRLNRGEAMPSLQEEGYLENAIENYRRGAELDLNEYFCASNLSLLLSNRGEPGDLEEAAFFDQMTLLASQRKIKRREDDGWARATLLGASFRVADVENVRRLARDVVREGAVAWKLTSTLSDIEDVLNGMAVGPVRQQLCQIRDQLVALLQEP